VCFVVHNTISELERTILTTLFLPGQKTPIVGASGRGIYSVLFLWMFRWLLHQNTPSLPTATTDIGLALGKTIHFSSLEFTTDHLGRLILSSKD
jgi:hypothetical protein